MPSTRADVTSSFTIIKGAMIEETYAVFASWQFDRSKRENLDVLRETNFIGASSQTWLRDVAKVLNRRFDPNGRDRAVVQLAKNRFGLEGWKPILLWHMTRDEFLLRDFLVNWLFKAYDSGVVRLEPDGVDAYLRGVEVRSGTVSRRWTDTTRRRVASSLLAFATDFGLVRGRVAKEFASYHLPEKSFLYLLHALREEHASPRRIIEAPDWKMFLMRASDVESELLRLHQYRKVEYQVAGSLVQLTLPYLTARDYVERMVA